VTALIGRERELAQVADRLEDHRVVTVVGPGGIGKTALAREVATRQVDRFSLGTRFVDLSLVDDHEAVGGALAAQLGFPSFTALLDSPGEQPALVVVDNCEHVLDAAAEAVDALLAACDSPVILATSRSPLDLPGESVVALGPLAVADDCVQLFLARARDAGTEVADDQLASVAALCAALDGLPLAIEIAAARARVLTPDEILARLGDLDTLSRPSFRGSERHRTLRATIEWSYVQLDDADRRLLDRLAVVAGPFTAATAAALGGADELATLDGLDALVRASLLVAETGGRSTRFRLLRTVRLFALERLDERGEADDAWLTFADHTLHQAAVLTPMGREAWRPAAPDDLVGLAEDLLASLRWCIAHDDLPDRALGLLAALWTVIHQSHMEDAALLGEEVLARWPEPSGPAWSDGMATVATCRHLLGRPEEAVALAELALRTTGPRTPLAACALPRVLGRARSSLGDPAGATAAFAETAAVAEEVGFPPFAREARTFQAIALAEQGDTGQASAMLQEVQAESAAAGDQTNELWARIAEGSLLLRTDPATAEATLEDALRAARGCDWGTGVVSALQGLSLARLATGDDEGAAATLVELLDEMIHGGAVSELRSALRAAAVALRRRGDEGWVDLAATAGRLPRISSLASLGPELFPLPDTRGRVLPTGEAVSRARRALLGAEAVTEARRPEEQDRPTPEARFQREGDAWRVGWAGRELVVRASKGMADLARLLATPGQDLHCLELAGAAAEQSSTGEVIDDTARREYEQRIRDLQAEIDEAEANHDHARAERAQTEFDAVVEHLASALGLGGRARRSGSTAERARSAVTHRIRATIRRLGEEHPELGRHLTASVTTGTYCSYRPEQDVTWTL